MNKTSQLSVSQEIRPKPYSPLCVDLDGTLVKTDLLHEALLMLARKNLLYLFCVPFWLLAGKANLKRRVAEHVLFDPASVPYNEEVVSWIREQKQLGRYLVLATASNRKFAEKIADYLGCFDEVFASDNIRNLSADAKRDVLVEKFGPNGFDYAGNSPKDLEVWKKCNQAIVVHASERTLAAARKTANVTQVIPKPTPRIKVWLRAARVQQWVKNLLVFLPLMTSHRVSDITAAKNALLVFLAFSVAASSTYVLNDLLDLAADRNHNLKASRPFASGDLSIVQGMGLALFSLASAILLAAFLPFSARVVLVSYLILTLLYSLWLKQKLILDVLILASLYTFRIVAGGVATHIKLSDWLISFSLFLFLSLAICKRSSELMNLLKARKTRTTGRFYETGDLEPLNICGICSGVLACLLLLLYGNSQQAQTLYATPRLLYFLCPILFYWISRLWILTFRGHLKEDPILFAVRDTVSYAVFIAMALVVMVAAFVKLPLDRFLQ
jgi:4-hydroxybenzoate polyprenyltransferase